MLHAQSALLFRLQKLRLSVIDVRRRFNLRQSRRVPLHITPPHSFELFDLMSQGPLLQVLTRLKDILDDKFAAQDS